MLLIIAVDENLHFQHDRCSTCHLNSYNCPGHAGHIELPVPVYNPIFINQVLTLLRSKCAYCWHFKLHPVETNRFICKLRLAEYGLVKQAEELEAITLETLGTEIDGVKGFRGGEEEEQEDSDNDVKLLGLQRRRNEFVKRAIKNSKGKRYLGTADREKVESTSEYRRSIIREFLNACTKNKRCGTCKGYEHLMLSSMNTNVYVGYLLYGGRTDATRFSEGLYLCETRHRWCKMTLKLSIL